MTRVYLTDEDYAVIDAGDTNEMKRHFNDLRGELVELQENVIEAVALTDVKERACALRAAVVTEEPK